MLPRTARLDRARACVNPPASSIAGEANARNDAPAASGPLRERGQTPGARAGSASLLRCAILREHPFGDGGFGPRLHRSCTRRARSLLNAHREVLETAHNRRAPVARLRPRKRNPLDSRGCGCDHGACLNAREFGADALVHSMPERRVLGSRACDVEPVGLAECRLVAVCRPCEQDHAFTASDGLSPNHRVALRDSEIGLHRAVEAQDLVECIARARAPRAAASSARGGA